jgi:hypothetical protein
MPVVVQNKKASDASHLWLIVSRVTAAVLGGYVVTSWTGAAVAQTAMAWDLLSRADAGMVSGPVQLVVYVAARAISGLRLLPQSLSDPIGGYFDGVYASIRAVPLDQATRSDLELYTFWLAWGVAAVHAFARAPHKAWTEQFAASAALCIGLPAIGYLVPNCDLGSMIRAGGRQDASRGRLLSARVVVVPVLPEVGRADGYRGVGDDSLGKRVALVFPFAYAPRRSVQAGGVAVVLAGLVALVS